MSDVLVLRGIVGRFQETLHVPLKRREPVPLADAPLLFVVAAFLLRTLVQFGKIDVIKGPEGAAAELIMLS